MPTVYIVTQGEYDSFGITGVFSTREKAIERAAQVNDRWAVLEADLDNEAFPQEITAGDSFQPLRPYL